MTNIAAHLPRVPLTCFWEITDACNLRCIHCEADAGKQAADELSTDEALVLVRELAEAGCRNVNLTGGEPLLRRDWPALAHEIAGLGMAPTVITNGLLVDDKAVSRMIESGVAAASVSLDGLRRVHDAIRQPPRETGLSRYDAAISALERLVASPLRTAVITQVHRHNIGDLEQMYEELVALGVDAWQVQLAMPLGRLLRVRGEYLVEPAQLTSLCERLARLVRDRRLAIAVADNIGYYAAQEPVLRGSLEGEASFWTGCLAGCRLVAICSNGDVKGCPSHPRSFVVGNVRDGGFARVWADPEGRFGYNTAFDESLLVGGCAACAYGKLCRAGCTTMAYAATGTIYDNPFCVQRAGGGSGREP